MKKYKWSILSIVLFLIMFFSGTIYKINAEETGKMWIDNPKQNQVYTNTDVNIRGWAIDKSVVEKIEIYLDGTKTAEARYGLSRPDVNRVYPGYPSGDNAGYSYTLPKDKVSAGYHTLIIKAINKTGSFSEKKVQFKMEKLPLKVHMDSPVLNQNYTGGNILVRGWAIDKSGVEKIDIYLDGNKTAEAQYGLSRPDVNRAYPGYPSGDNAGYAYNIPVNSVSAGSHIITVKAYGKDGGYSEIKRSISISKLPSMIRIDSPKENQTISGKDFTLNGWAVNQSGIKNAEIFIDNKSAGNAKYGAARPDVNRVYPGYPSGDNAGYSYEIDLTGLSAGKHSITVKAVGNDGYVSSLTRNIIVDKLKTILHIDNPKNYQTYNNSDITVRGWSLNPDGIKNISITVDGKQMGQATYGAYRADVNRVYPGYPSGNNSGYVYNIDVDLICPGNHLVKVISEGNNGIKTEASSLITVNKLPVRMNLETPNISKYYNDIFVKGWAVNPSKVTKIDVLLDGKVIGQATYGAYRPDVNRVYPGYPSGNNSGFTYTIKKDLMANGNHTVTVIAYGKDGTKQQKSKSFAYEKLDNKIKIENPVSDYTSNNQDIAVKGYALIPSGTTKIDVVLDNTKIGEASINISRSDLGILFPQYTSSKTSGFSYNIDVDKVKPGTHNLYIKAYGADGTSIGGNVSFNVTKPVSMMRIDTPKDSASYYMEDIPVQGWALNASGVKSVNIYLNNKLIGQAKTGLSRPDVDRVYPGYKGGATSGYSYTISKSLLSTGIYSIKAVETGYDGTVFSVSKTVNVDMDKVTTVSTNYNCSLETALFMQLLVNPQQAYPDRGWDTADSASVKYYLDPNNFISSPTYKYQFLVLNYTPGITVDEINSILSGKGALSGYGSSFLNGAMKNNVSVAYVVSHALLETGNGTSQLAYGITVSQVDGKPVTPKMVYNMFGYGASDSDPVRLGSEYAYKHGWFTKDAAIQGGISIISSSYINNSTYKQNTIYKMRWDPANPGVHQYATDICWANSQTYYIKKIMDQYPNAKLVFDIPVYK